MLSFSGMPMYESHLLPPDFTRLTLPKFSPYRSKRVWKKIMKRVRAASGPGWNQVYCIMGKMYAHPTVIDAIKRATTDNQGRDYPKQEG